MNALSTYRHFANRAEWRAWLEKYHAEKQEVWLVHYKKDIKAKSLSYEEGVEEALCFGWIDGLLKRIDAQKFALRYSPRKKNSIWAENNKKRVAKLIREGRMTDGGLAKIAEAKQSGEWRTATERENVEAIISKLERALWHSKGALAAFRKLTPSRKKQYAWWVSSAKREETRKQRIHAIVEMVNRMAG